MSIVQEKLQNGVLGEQKLLNLRFQTHQGQSNSHLAILAKHKTMSYCKSELVQNSKVKVRKQTRKGELQQGQSAYSIFQKKYGFRIIRNNQYRELYSRSKELNQQLWEHLRKCAILTQFKEDYSLEKMVGKGNFAKVYQTINKETKKLYAVKVFEKSKIKNSETDRLALVKEMTIMRKLDHKGLIKMYEVYEDDSNVFFILEYLEGGELHNHIQKNQKFPEKVVAKILATVLDSLDYLQKSNVLHRDLKPDNLILRNKGILDDVVITDFGLADIYSSTGNYMFSRCGTPGFVAPEVLQDKLYDFKIDIFSVGCLMYLLLTHKQAFRGTNYDEIVMKNYHCKVDYQSIENEISADAMSLLKQLLHPKSQCRPSARLALKHKWFQTNLDEVRFKQLNCDLSETKDSTMKSSLSDIPFLYLNKSQNSKLNFSTPQQRQIIQKNQESQLFTPQAMLQIDESLNDNINSLKILDDTITDIQVEDESPQSHLLPQYQLISKMKLVVDSKASSLYGSPMILNTPDVTARKLIQGNQKDEIAQIQPQKRANKVMNNLRSLESQ
ncbi:unnamed protein product (macronuclear) [Paramecium tetraurelia]|uniref:non-specific serine/threonine protein kinase n=1 Tax=Paramecium tetraurelia TaxID=5888 RepID=A0BCY5_PARTE|nr:uncharacterized protein GSPATT00004496001 [Paramecium tetraurelia]CAK56402.1 unnamed protein product [Paramecium tetraurelia]|eukprot:XP_001423800.1 hypothetical protein (macronuclear) [Paramecium tetraurelia strain d4-2]